MTDIFDIEGLIIIISEYIGSSSDTFIKYLDNNYLRIENKTKKLDYLFTLYLIDEETILPIEYLKLRYLYFEGNADQLNMFSNLLILIFCTQSDQEIKVLPNSLTTLTFGDNFNQKIKPNVLPNSLQSLTFGDNFDQEIKKSVLPTSLTTLTFGWNFNQELK
jgi:hypothetical protein